VAHPQRFKFQQRFWLYTLHYKLGFDVQLTPKFTNNLLSLVNFDFLKLLKLYIKLSKDLECYTSFVKVFYNESLPLFRISQDRLLCTYL